MLQETKLYKIVFSVHYLRWRMPHFMRQCWGLPDRLAKCTRPQGRGKLVNAALLSLINEACVNVCCATLLSSELVGPAFVQARSSNPRCKAGRVGLMGRDLGRRGYWVTLYLYIYTARLYFHVNFSKKTQSLRQKQLLFFKLMEIGNLST